MEEMGSGVDAREEVPRRPQVVLAVAYVRLVARGRRRAVAVRGLIVDEHGAFRRDAAERHRTTEQVLQQYVGTVRPMHERYVEPTRAHADVIVTNDGPIEDTVERVINVLRGRIADGSAIATTRR